MKQKMKQCPDCASWMDVDQTSCRCGYRFGSEPQQKRRPACGIEGCGKESICAVWKNGRLVNVCRDHYEDHFADIASRYCDQKGFRTVRDMVMFCRKMMAMKDAI